MVLFFMLSPISLTLFVTASFAFVNAPVMLSLIALNFSLICDHNFVTASFALSQFLINRTIAAIIAAIIATTPTVCRTFNATPNAVVAAVAVVVAAVCAVVATVPAAVAAVDAVSAAVVAAVAAVFAVIFAIIFAAPDTNFCPVVTVSEIPFATFPNPIDNGPIAATTRPTLRMVSCCAGDSDVNHFVNS